ncbi:MAG: hypothetical protein IT250_15085 [Chitinophagaceae bacterium]|nr:hypothetical protein [Chitinophagaceae bacterium]
MKFKLIFRLLPFAFIAFFACSAPDKPANITDSTGIAEAETIFEQPDTVLFWTINSEKKAKIRVYKDTVAITEPISIVNGINAIYPSIHLDFIRISGDTVYAHIDSSFSFANDMGSFGAEEYITGVVLNLTMLPGINYVNLDFPEGSHAAPGVFAKSSYAAYKETEEE